MTMHEFKLYVIGRTQKSVEVAWNLESLLNEELKGRYSLEVISVLDNPEHAVEDNILVTPALLRISPPPKRRIIGDFSNKEEVLSELGLTAEKEGAKK